MHLSMLFLASILWTLTLVGAKSFWSESPANFSNFISTAFPLGNGRLGAMPLGLPGAEIINLNIDSLWSGGPFENPFYSGGNPNVSKADALPGIREFIFQNGTGNVSALLGEFPNYGSYQVLANLTVDMGDWDFSDVRGYRRSLDLETGVYGDRFGIGDGEYEREAFCSYPDQVCVYRLVSSSSLPAVVIGLQNTLASPPPDVTCENNSISLYGRTYPSTGMIYNARATVVVPGLPASHDFCPNSFSTIKVPKGQKEVMIIISAGTDYDSSKGNAAAGYTFKGDDPYSSVLEIASQASRQSYKSLKASHTKDFKSLSSGFKLTLPDPRGSAEKPTTSLIASYSQPGDPFVENLLFDYSRYLFISSSRPGSLPPNLQGLWTEQASPAWSADYHANINLQMNHWAVEQTGLGDLTEPLWTYMTDTWMPRGAETARLLYAAPEGWVTHDEMNIFGHTAMKNDAQWANYPAVNAWMAQHVWDHFDYAQNVSWYQHTGYPILKGAAQFWLSQLVQDEYFKDGTWVVNPCNSPEHGPTTFGCTHYQQLLHQLFTHILHSWSSSADTNSSFRTAIASKLPSLDKGLHIGSWGQIQEWKLDLDSPTDTHRHLSHLYGWYPGSSISSLFALPGSSSNTTTNSKHNTTAVLAAVKTSLLARSTGSEDQNTGWAKVWRSACWALLDSSQNAYSELTLAIKSNIAVNGLSMYSTKNEAPFQIDANFGLQGAVLGMLVRDLDASYSSSSLGLGLGLGEQGFEQDEQKVLLGPAIPAAWGGGSVEGLRLRRGGVVRFRWDEEGVVRACWVDLSARKEGAARVVFLVRGGARIECGMDG